MSNNSNYAKNPKTNRYIKIGGRTWRTLMKEGIIDQGSYKDPNVLYELDEDNFETVEDRRAHLIQEKAKIVKTKKMPPGYHLAMSKNKKIVYQRAKMTNEESSRKTANAALDVVDAIQNNEVEIPEDMSRAQARDYLQGLIFNQMLAGGKKFKNTKLEKLGRPKNFAEISRSKVVKKVVTSKARAAEPFRAPVRKVRSIQDYMPSRKIKAAARRKPIIRKNTLTSGKPQKKVQFVKPKKEPVYYLPEEELEPIQEEYYEEEDEELDELEEYEEEYYEED